MKNPFRQTGFDALIPKGMAIQGSLLLPPGTTTILDGEFSGSEILDKDGGSTIVINGTATMIESIVATNVTITGTVVCKSLLVSGTLAIKNGAVVKAEKIVYGKLVVEPEAKITGTIEPKEA
jgi:cytoskeletal protein CcmA (bactofilin family)